MILGGGTYSQLKITGTYISDGKTPGEPVIKISLVDPEAPDMGITDFLYTSNNAWDKMTKKRLKAYGFDVDTTPLFDLDGDESPLKGKVVGPVTIKEEDYQGKTQYRVAQVGEFISERLEPSKAKEIEAALSARLGIKKQGAAKRVAPKSSAVTPSTDKAVGAEDDDVPF